MQSQEARVAKWWWAWIVLLPAPCSLLPAQAPPRYQSRFLACAAFVEEVRTRVAGRRAMESWEERGNRVGRVVVAADPPEAPIRFEAWYDSLEITHDGRDGPLRPDTDGLIGGRWRGRMAAHGEVSLEERPFIPPELRAVSDLSDAMLDFFPPLPTVALPPRGRWSDSLGLEVERLSDSAASGETVQRYRWQIRGAGGPLPLDGDTTVRLRQEIRDEGVLAWSSTRGPLGWRREIVVEAQLGAARGPRSPVQSRVTQSVTVRRVTDARCR